MEVCIRLSKEKQIKEILFFSIFHSECSLDCGNSTGQCLKTEITNMPEICACSNGMYTNSSCADVDNENENNNSFASINIHGLSMRI